MVTIMSEKENEAERICQQGIDLCDVENAQNLAAAHKLFQKAYEMFPASPRINSWLGYTTALVENKVGTGMQFCKKAIESDVPDALFYRNMGKLYLLQKNKRSAIGTFAKGLQIEKGNKYILKEWKVLGFRRRPVIGFLSREHPLNKLLGRWTYKNNK
jgi:tetratricopeptide (TPR) repeat protein